MKPQLVPNGTTEIKPKTPTEKQVNALRGLDDDALLQRALESLHALNRRAKKCRDSRDRYRRASFAKALSFQVDSIYQLKDRLLEALIRSNLAKVEKFSVAQTTGYAFYCCGREWFARSSGSMCFCCGEFDDDGYPQESKRTWFIVECHGFRFHRPTLPDDLAARAVEVEPHDPTQPQREIPKIGLTIAAQTRCIEMMAERLEARLAGVESAAPAEETLAVAPFGPVKCSTGGTELEASSKAVGS